MPFQPPPPKRTVTVRAEPPPEMARELTLLQENALITPEAAKALTVASANLQVMKRVSTGVGHRHFNKIDTLLAVRKPTPVSEAREVLASLNGTWENVAGDYHKYRKLHFQAKLMRAKLNKSKNAVLADLAELTLDDRDIAEAQAALDQASIDEIEAEVAKGHGALKIALEQATAASAKYALICQAAGKDPAAGGFTEDDFLGEECDYYLKSAFWHVSQNFRETDMRGKWARPTKPATNARDEHALKYGGTMTDGTSTEGYRKFSKIQADTEVKLYLEGIGVAWPQVQMELNKMLASQEGPGTHAHEPCRGSGEREGSPLPSMVGPDGGPIPGGGIERFEATPGPDQAHRRDIEPQRPGSGPGRYQGRGSVERDRMKTITVREISPALLRALKDMAKREHRSMQGQIMHLLKQSVAPKREP